MLFQVEMDVDPPHDINPERFEKLKAAEKERAQALMQSGTWRHLWRIAGQYKNVSIFDVESIDELHEILLSLPLYPFMTMRVTALCRHPSSIREDDT